MFLPRSHMGHDGAAFKLVFRIIFRLEVLYRDAACFLTFGSIAGYVTESQGARYARESASKLKVIRLRYYTPTYNLHDYPPLAHTISIPVYGKQCELGLICMIIHH